MLDKRKRLVLQYISEYGMETLLDNLIDIVKDNKRFSRDEDYLEILHKNLTNTLLEYQNRNSSEATATV